MTDPWEMLNLARAHLAARWQEGLRRQPLRVLLNQVRRLSRRPLRAPAGLKLVLERPEERLVVYGTLVPGGQYHRLLADLPAHWEQCAIRGSMGWYRGYKAFRWNPGGAVHPAWLVTSPHLPRKFAELDDFEGQAYRRRLIPVEVGRRLVIANVYESRILV